MHAKLDTDAPSRSGVRSRFQFRLRTLLLVTAGLALVLGIGCWINAGLAIYGALILSGAVVLDRGIKRRNIAVVVGGCVLLGAGLALIAISPTVSSTHGYQHVVVPFRLLDSSNGQPLQNALVSVEEPSWFRSSPRRPGAGPQATAVRTGPDGLASVEIPCLVNTSTHDYLFGLHRVEEKRSQWVDCVLAVQAGQQSGVPCRIPLRGLLPSTPAGLSGSPLPVQVQFSRESKADGDPAIGVHGRD